MTRIAAALSALQLPVASADNLSKFSALFRRWNQSINLSAARTERDIEDHIVDSLHVVPHLRAESPAPASTSTLRVLDVGAGGGLPAIVAAILLADAHITALEPVHKKHAFLRTVARELSLSNFEPLAQRLEDHPHTDYDAAMSRATFDLREWLLLGLTHVHPGGIVFGFEATPRADLPPSTQHNPYQLRDKSRSIVSLRRPTSTSFSG